MIKEDIIYIEHILDALKKITEYISGKDEASFLKDSLVQDAVIRQFEVIGEATKRISKDFREKHTSVPWKDMAGMRDVLIHDYIDVDIFMVWKTANEDAPVLIKQIQAIFN
jgi:uncharacterized protein with HEPN domain